MASTVALAVGFFALLVWDLFQISRDLEAGQAGLDDLTLDAAASTGLSELAEDAAGHLRSAASRAHSSLPLRALSLLPVVDDQISGIRRMGDVTAELGTVGAEAARRLDDQLEEAGEPAGRIALLDAALEELDRIDATLDTVDIGSGDRLLPPLRGAHQGLAAAIERAREKLDEGRALVEPVREMLNGPTSFLLLAANNAEMGSGGGLTLSAGILTFNGGDFELGAVVRAGAFRLPRLLPLPDHLRAIYRPVGVGIDLRSTTRSPDLSTMGPIARDIILAHDFPGVDDLDGVIVVDAVALADLMAITGDVVVEDKTITAETVLAEVLHNNYLEFGTPEERGERIDYQGEIAKAIFESVTTGAVSSIDLAETLLDTAEGRHLLLWGADPDLQAVWEEMDLAGAVNELGLLIAFQNHGANKMDWYLRPEAALDVDLLPSGDYRARLTMTMDIPSVEEMPEATPYILGPNDGVHGVWLTVHLPEAAYDITTPHPDGFTTKGEEPPMQVRTYHIDMPLGDTFEYTIDFSLPREVSGMVLLPSARVEPLPLTIDGVATVTDAAPTAISWLAVHASDPGDDSVTLWVRIPALAGLAATVVASGAVAVGTVRRRRDATTTGRPRATVRVAVAALICFVGAGVLAAILAIPRV